MSQELTEFGNKVPCVREISEVHVAPNEFRNFLALAVKDLRLRRGKGDEESLSIGIPVQGPNLQTREIEVMGKQRREEVLQRDLQKVRFP